jgi:WD40 repeat protein
MGKAIKLDATRRQYISLERPELLNFGESGNFSISLWVRAKEYSPATITENISKILKTPISQRNQSENKALKLYYTSTQSLSTPTILEGHEEGVWNAEFSRDGNQVITVSQDETARIWNTKTGQTEHILRPETGPVREVFFNADSSRVITASGEESMTLWDPRTGRLVHKFDNLGSRVVKVIFNPDGHKLVAITEDGDLHLWEAAPWRLDDLPGDSSLSWKERYNLWNKKWLTHKWQTN